MKEQLIQFREQLYQRLYLYNRADIIFDIVDALCCGERMQSVVESTLHLALRDRHYSALYQGVAYFPLQRKNILPLLLAYEPRPRQRPSRPYSVNVKPVPRPYANRLRDRHFVYRSTLIPGQKSVTVGTHLLALGAFAGENDVADSSWQVADGNDQPPTANRQLLTANC